MIRRKSVKHYVRLRDKAIYHYEANLCRAYGLTSKQDDLGRYYGLLRKYQGLARRQGQHSAPHQLARQAMIRRGILEPSATLSSLVIEDFLKRRLVYILHRLTGHSLRKVRQWIITGKVYYMGERIRRPSALIPVNRTTEVVLKDK